MWTILLNFGAILLGIVAYIVLTGTVLAVACVWHMRNHPPRLEDVDLEEFDRDIAYLKARAAARERAERDPRRWRRPLRRALSGSAQIFGALFALPIVLALKLQMRRTTRRADGT